MVNPISGIATEIEQEINCRVKLKTENMIFALRNNREWITSTKVINNKYYYFEHYHYPH